jgi:2,4-dienoyl-CoA reductase-like NADH-dependent reductase (Old Yellow Enzyme family)/thioredoxin reductase
MAQHGSLTHLLSPGRIGSLEIRNRIIMAPMGENLPELDGFMGERFQQFYEERARGGVGLIIVGVASVAYPEGQCNANQVAVSDDKFIPAMKQFTERIHAHGAKVALQLQHAGKVARMDIPAGRARMVPSEYNNDIGDILDNLTHDELMAMSSDFMKEGAVMAYHPMTIEEIQTLVARFADAADRAKRSGFDGIEIHGGHGYIISSFISPSTNKRQDEYGGSLENRARLLTDVIKAVRARVGDDFPIWCRLDGKEILVDGGITEDDARKTAVLAKTAGAEAIDVSAYGNPKIGAAFTVAPLVQKPGGFIDLAEGIRKSAQMPVIAVGRIEPDVGDRIIREGKADFIGIARQLIADPELPSKLIAAHPEDIRPCICCYNCVGEIFLNRPLICAVNAVAGKEYDTKIEKTESRKRVLVVGGGPAGMESARIAALRGHDVILCEKSNRLGGTLYFASILSDDNEKLLDWLTIQAKKLPIDVRLNTEVTPDVVNDIRPDVVVLAVGAGRKRPDVHGVDLPHVLDGDDLRAMMTGSDKKVIQEKLSLVQRTMLGIGMKSGIANSLPRVRELTKLWMPVGKNVAIIGGGLVGVELAVFLDERKRNVTLIEEGKGLATELAIPKRWHAVNELHESKVRVMTQTQVESIGKKEISCVSQDGQKTTLPVDTVVIAKGVQENRSLAERLEALGCQVHLVGDCSSVEYIKGAIREGFDVGSSI